MVREVHSAFGLRGRSRFGGWVWKQDGNLAEEKHEVR